MRICIHAWVSLLKYVSGTCAYVYTYIYIYTHTNLGLRVYVTATILEATHRA